MPASRIAAIAVACSSSSSSFPPAEGTPESGDTVTAGGWPVAGTQAAERSNLQSCQVGFSTGKSLLHPYDSSTCSSSSSSRVVRQSLPGTQAVEGVKPPDRPRVGAFEG